MDSSSSLESSLGPPCEEERGVCVANEAAVLGRLVEEGYSSGGSSWCEGWTDEEMEDEDDGRSAASSAPHDPHALSELRRCVEALRADICKKDRRVMLEADVVPPVWVTLLDILSTLAPHLTFFAFLFALSTQLPDQPAPVPISVR